MRLRVFVYVCVRVVCVTAWCVCVCVCVLNSRCIPPCVCVGGGVDVHASSQLHIPGNMMVSRGMDKFRHLSDVTNNS